MKKCTAGATKSATPQTTPSGGAKGGGSSSVAEVPNNDETSSQALGVAVIEPKPEQPAEERASGDMNSGAAGKKVVKRVVRAVKKVPGMAKNPAPGTGMGEVEEGAKVEERVDVGVVMGKGGAEVGNDAELSDKQPLVAGGEEPAASVRRFVIDLEQPALEDPDEESGGVAIDAMAVMEVEESAGVCFKEGPSSETVMEIVSREKLEKEVCAASSGEAKLQGSVDNGAVDLDENITNSAKANLFQKDKSVGDVQCSQGGTGGASCEDYGEQVDFEEDPEEDPVEEDPEEDPVEDPVEGPVEPTPEVDTLEEEGPVEPAPEVDTLEEERRELAAAAENRKSRKEFEIFVGGLDRDATEEDVKRVFVSIGEVVDIRLHKDLATNKNKGYAFVKFANKEHVKRALSEMKNPVIRGKRCGTAPSEDNDTIFLGNICNTWTKEAIRQKLKDYGVEGVENITLVPDAQHEGRSRGFAFIEFSCHADAMLAYKRLQKPDVIFGHAERTAKVAFAEPIREPDPEIMAQVKTVFLDGIPPHWDEEQVREQLKNQGEIVRIVLARNMSTAKRKDFGFVDFSTHDAAVACIETVNKADMGDGNWKTRLRARLSNPLPKTQAVKGGMCGGFRIGSSGDGTHSRFVRGQHFARGGSHTSRPHLQHGRNFHQRRGGHNNRPGPAEFEYDNRHSAYHGRQNMGRGGRSRNLRGGYHPAGRGVAAAGPSRSSYDRPWYNAPERVPEDHVPFRRPPFFSEEGFDRPFAGRHFDDPYYYDDGPHGMKRPFFVNEHHPEYVEPSRTRPRLDHADPRASFHGSNYQDAYGGGGDPYSREYYGSDYGPYPPYYGSERSHGRGYYY